MNRVNTSSLVFLLALSVASPAMSEESEGTARQLLSRVAAHYGALSAYHFKAHDTSETRFGDRKRVLKRSFITAVNEDGLSRVELHQDTGGGLAIFDGKTSWVYVQNRHQYFRRSAQPIRGLSQQPPMPGEVDLQKFIDQYPIRYRGVDERLKSATHQGSEELGYNSRGANCTIIRAEYESPVAVAASKIERVYWIDPASLMVVREVSFASTLPKNRSTPVEVTQTIDFEIAQAGPILSDAQFVFRPPSGAVEVEGFSQTTVSPRGGSGEPAPGFSLTDLSGQSWRLSDLQGKVVLLDFWATWCGPCRIDMPHMEALHKEFGGQGLVVLGVNNESPALASSYLARHGYTFPTLSDVSNEAARSYRVSSIPTAVIVNRQGEISSYLVGLQTEERLREAVLEAGLESDPRFR